MSTEDNSSQKENKIEWVIDRLSMYTAGSAEVCDSTCLIADGYENAVIGLVNLNGDAVVAYSQSKIIESLVADGMTEPEAMEYFSFNIEGAAFSSSHPIFVDDIGLSDYTD